MPRAGPLAPTTRRVLHRARKWHRGTHCQAGRASRWPSPAQGRRATASLVGAVRHPCTRLSPAGRREACMWASSALPVASSVGESGCAPSRRTAAARDAAVVCPGLLAVLADGRSEVPIAPGDRRYAVSPPPPARVRRRQSSQPVRETPDLIEWGGHVRPGVPGKRPFSGIECLSPGWITRRRLRAPHAAAGTGIEGGFDGTLEGMGRPPGAAHRRLPAALLAVPALDPDLRTARTARKPESSPMWK